MKKKLESQKANHDKHSKEHSFGEGDKIYFRAFSGPYQWLPGKIVKVLGPVSFGLVLANGDHVRRHVDHLRKRESEVEEFNMVMVIQEI